MKPITTGFRSAAIISFILVFPILILELVNRKSFHEGFSHRVIWLFVAFANGIHPPLDADRAKRKSRKQYHGEPY